MKYFSTFFSFREKTALLRIRRYYKKRRGETCGTKRNKARAFDAFLRFCRLYTRARQKNIFFLGYRRLFLFTFFRFSCTIIRQQVNRFQGVCTQNDCKSRKLCALRAGRRTRNGGSGYLERDSFVRYGGLARRGGERIARTGEKRSEKQRTDVSEP